MPLWLGKIIATRIIKAIKRKIDLKKIDKYVNKPNELDKQMKQVQKNLSKYGKYIESLEKEVAILKDVASKTESIKDKFSKLKF